eukprot:836872-Prymnesium_polylepis.1
MRDATRGHERPSRRRFHSIRGTSRALMRPSAARARVRGTSHAFDAPCPSAPPPRACVRVAAST